MTITQILTQHRRIAVLIVLSVLLAITATIVATHTAHFDTSVIHRHIHLASVIDVIHRH